MVHHASEVVYVDGVLMLIMVNDDTMVTDLGILRLAVCNG